MFFKRLKSRKEKNIAWFLTIQQSLFVFLENEHPCPSKRSNEKPFPISFGVFGKKEGEKKRTCHSPNIIYSSVSFLFGKNQPEQNGRWLMNCLLVQFWQRISPGTRSLPRRPPRRRGWWARSGPRPRGRGSGIAGRSWKPWSPQRGRGRRGAGSTRSAV